MGLIIFGSPILIFGFIIVLIIILPLWLVISDNDSEYKVKKVNNKSRINNSNAPPKFKEIIGAIDDKIAPLGFELVFSSYDFEDMALSDTIELKFMRLNTNLEYTIVDSNHLDDFNFDFKGVNKTINGINGMYKRGSTSQFYYEEFCYKDSKREDITIHVIFYYSATNVHFAELIDNF